MPSRTWATIPNAVTSSGIRPMTQVARRAAITLAGCLGSEATAAERSRSSLTASSAVGRGIRMTVSPNRPTRP
jgi:hypothetical protein